MTLSLKLVFFFLQVELIVPGACALGSFSARDFREGRFLVKAN